MVTTAYFFLLYIEDFFYPQYVNNNTNFIISNIFSGTFSLIRSNKMYLTIVIFRTFFGEKFYLHFENESKSFVMELLKI